MKVSVVRVDPRDVEGAVREAIDLLGYRPSRARVLLKPNYVTYASPGGSGGVVTSLEVLEALVRVFEGHEIAIGEGSCVGLDTGDVLKASGVEALAKRYGVHIVDFDHCDRERFPWSRGELELPAILKTHSLVNVPVMKTHGLTGVSLGVKNLKGLLSQKDKKRFHLSLDLDEAIRDLGRCVRPELTVVDAVTALEGNGPGYWGRPRAMNLIAAGTDVFSTDAVACRIMGVDAGAIRHLGPVDPDGIRVAGEDPDRVGARFEKPIEAENIEFGALRIHNVRRACSACLLSLERGLEHGLLLHKRAIKEGNRRYGPGGLSVLIGLNGAVEGQAARTVCYGDCSSRAANRGGHPFIEGCPPAPEDYVRIYLD